jgi:hypothetical protein
MQNHKKPLEEAIEKISEMLNSAKAAQSVGFLVILY